MAVFRTALMLLKHRKKLDLKARFEKSVVNFENLQKNF